jgi:hypothetical protein
MKRMGRRPLLAVDYAEMNFLWDTFMKSKRGAGYAGKGIKLA